MERVLEDLYRTQRPHLERFFRQTTGTDPADLVQETFVRAYASRSRYLPELGAPCQWLYGIARNVRSEFVRHETVRPAKEVALVPIDTLEIEGPAIDRVDALLIWGALIAALSTLQVDDLEVVTPLVCAALSGAVVARRSNAQHLRLHRLRARLSGEVLGRT